MIINWQSPNVKFKLTTDEEQAISFQLMKGRQFRSWTGKIITEKGTKKTPGTRVRVSGEHSGGYLVIDIGIKPVHRTNWPVPEDQLMSISSNTTIHMTQEHWNEVNAVATEAWGAYRALMEGEYV